MANPLFFRYSSITLALSGLLLCGGCDQTRPPQKTAAPTRLTAPEATVSEATVSEVAALTRHYADLLSRRARLPTAASREGAMPFAEPSTEGQEFSRTFSTCRIYLDLDSTFLLESVTIEQIPPPEDPNPTTLNVPPQPAHLVQLGEVRRQFGRERKTDGLPEETHTYDFSCHPRPQLRPVTIQAEIHAFKLTDSTMVERLLLLPTQPH